MPLKAVMAWSGGKDSACALWRMQQDARYEVVSLLTTLTEGYDRVSMAGIRRELLLGQAAALGLPVREVWIPQVATNEVYEERMGAAVEQMLAEGVRAVAFGDLFLEDVRAYRERTLADTGLEPVFPIWGAPTLALAHRVMADGFRAVLVCVDPRQVPAELASRDFDASLLADLPPEADPCAERGEFQRSCTMRRTSRHRSRLRAARWLSARGSCSRTCCPARRRSARPRQLRRRLRGPRQ